MSQTERKEEDNVIAERIHDEEPRSEREKGRFQEHKEQLDVWGQRVMVGEKVENMTSTKLFKVI